MGLDISILEELAKAIDIYISDTDEPRRLRRQEVKHVEMEKAEGWQEILLDEPVEARFVRFDLLENHGTPIPWTETSEIKMYP